MRLVITRPAEDAERLAAELRRLGHKPSIHPLLEIVYPPLPPITLDGIAALIATSRNALRGLAGNAAFEAVRALPVYCVGEATAALARQLSFADIRTGTGTAKELAPLIVLSARPEAGALLYLTGEQLAFDLEAALTVQGFTVRRLTVYEASEASATSASRLIEKLRAGVDGVILMSPRTANVFAAILGRAELGREAHQAITCYCLSEAVARPLRNVTELSSSDEAIGQSKLTISVARRPTEADLLALIGEGR